MFGLGLLIFGGLVIAWAFRARKIRGLGQGKTISLDDLLLVSERDKIVGRPDRIVRQAGNVIPEEWKPTATRIYQSHRLQVAVYCLLIEEKFGVRPPFGVVVLAGGVRVEVPYTDELRAEVSRRRRKSASVGGTSSVKSPCGSRLRNAERAASVKTARRPAAEI